MNMATFSPLFSKLKMCEDAPEMASARGLKSSKQSYFLSSVSKFSCFTSPLHRHSYHPRVSVHQPFLGKMQELSSWHSFQHSPNSSPLPFPPRLTFLKHSSHHTASLIQSLLGSSHSLMSTSKHFMGIYSWILTFPSTLL